MIRTDPLAELTPVAIGGAGGSGTRLIARLLGELGVYPGDDLNGSADNLWFTLLFKHPALLDSPRAEFRRRLILFANAMYRRRPWTPEESARLHELAVADHPQHSAEWFAERVNTLRSSISSPAPAAWTWGWKEPNTHWFLDRLDAEMPRLRYIHVLRNGLDMACSSNQNQYRLWSRRILGDRLGGTDPPTPRQALKFWCQVHRRVFAVTPRLGKRFLYVDFDALCRHPVQGLNELLQFLQLTVDDARRRTLEGMVQRPASQGRFKSLRPADFDAHDIAYVHSLGFDTRFD